MKNFSMLVCVVLVGVVSGCQTIPNPLPGDIAEEVIISFPAHPLVMAWDAGNLGTKLIKSVDGKRMGFAVTKTHWLVKETGTAIIWLPEGALNIGLKSHKDWFGGAYWASFDLNGERYMNRYYVPPHPKSDDDWKLKQEFLWNPETFKFELIEV